MYCMFAVVTLFIWLAMINIHSESQASSTGIQ